MNRRVIENTITDNYINKTVKFFIDNLDHCEYENEGEIKTIEFQKKEIIENNIVQVFIYFDDLFLGDITNIRIIDTSGDVAISINETFNKSTDNGLYILFKYNFVEVNTTIESTRVDNNL